MENPIPFHERLSCTVGDACAYTGLGRTKMYEEIGKGRVATVVVGKRRLILVASLIRRLGADAPGG